ncbi:hypothetical protein [Roseibium limicola]|uniref:Uncharacterized protein n=1 Tax=Roseibium limicola TaxID=2816037 RepID=A0A939EPI1_9HYPH|nr:hypothetical protein [Roseibium limicola]MBO0346555.1 hypothetical protein [Roseibium limicola]
MENKLPDHTNALRRLTNELHRLEQAPDEPSKRLRMLLLKRDFEDLLKEMKDAQEEVSETISRSGATARAASAYITQAAFLARNQRS